MAHLISNEEVIAVYASRPDQRKRRMLRELATLEIVR
jgi:hypothetical protein